MMLMNCLCSAVALVVLPGVWCILVESGMLLHDRCEAAGFSRNEYSVLVLSSGEDPCGMSGWRFDGRHCLAVVHPSHAGQEEKGSHDCGSGAQNPDEKGANPQSAHGKTTQQEGNGNDSNETQGGSQGAAAVCHDSGHFPEGKQPDEPLVIDCDASSHPLVPGGGVSAFLAGVLFSFCLQLGGVYVLRRYGYRFKIESLRGKVTEGARCRQASASTSARKTEVMSVGKMAEKACCSPSDKEGVGAGAREHVDSSQVCKALLDGADTLENCAARERSDVPMQFRESVASSCSEHCDTPATWEDFSHEPLEKELNKPAPSFCLAPSRDELTGEEDSSFWPAPTKDELLALLAEPENQSWIRACRSFEQQVRIAEEFRHWAAGRPDGDSLLLTAQPGVCYWFVGDVHGDFESLARIYAYIRQAIVRDCEHDRHVLILLGDLIDRGEEELAVLALVQTLLMQPDKTDTHLTLVTLRGNHDCALSYDGGRGEYRSAVDPAETSELLNRLACNGYARESRILGEAMMELGRISPCMGELSRILPDRPEATILFTHGGVPHTDLQRVVYNSLLSGKIGEGVGLIPSLPEELRRAWMDDYTWVRLVEKGPTKRPNRESHGCQMGTQDVNLYRRLHLRLTKRAITFIIRGHDHEEGGFKLYSYDPTFNPVRGGNVFSRVQENCGVLTINAMDRGGEEEGEAVAARWCVGESISLYRFPFDR